MEKSLPDSKKMFCPLSKKQRKKWKKHFNRKISFYKEKEAQNWLLWPKKFVNQSEDRKEKIKSKRTYRDIKRKEKKIKEKADLMITDGDVRVLVDIEVPPEAIAVLGKGLGYVPTPNLDPIEARLDARQVTNKITYLANRSLEEETNNDEKESVDTSESDEEEIEDNAQRFCMPKSLREPNYFQAHLESTDPEFV